ncbi:MAG TPA: hypothetical protein VF618_26675 [Thermoanaerobaculia bacterium]
MDYKQIVRSDSLIAQTLETAGLLLVPLAVIVLMTDPVGFFMLGGTLVLFALAFASRLYNAQRSIEAFRKMISHAYLFPKERRLTIKVAKLPLDVREQLEPVWGTTVTYSDLQQQLTLALGSDRARQYLPEALKYADAVAAGNA